MNKSYSRDVSVLIKLSKTITDIRDVMTSFKVDFSRTNKALCNNKYAFDLCALYMAQFGEKVKLLTDSSKAELSQYVNLETLVRFRNIIDHDYESVNKVMLQAYIQQVVSKEFLDIIDARILYCKEKMKSR